MSLENAYAKLANRHKVLVEKQEQLKTENAELRQDKERLDWLLSSESNTNIEVGRYGRGDEYKPWVVDTLHNRADIDEAMGGAG
jgi:hypothetical protein